MEDAEDIQIPKKRKNKRKVQTGRNAEKKQTKREERRARREEKINGGREGKPQRERERLGQKAIHKVRVCEAN